MSRVRRVSVWSTPDVNSRMLLLSGVIEHSRGRHACGFAAERRRYSRCDRCASRGSGDVGSWQKGGLLLIFQTMFSLVSLRFIVYFSDCRCV